MEEKNIYQDIAQRTNGDIYIGVVGPVRSGKSTFIKRFMDSLVIPNMDSSYKKERALDELPQSAAGRTIMTTEPKFIPETAAEVQIGDNASFKVRLIDCVGYIVPSSLGYIEDEQPRMVKTPWFEEAVPFNMAAEIGTKKVITDHSTIGLVITTDASISDIPREEYQEAEERVINELKEIKKPFIVLLNSMYPTANETKNLTKSLTEKYKVPVLAVNCIELNENEIKRILAQILFEFPIKEIKIDMPKWLTSLEKTHWLRKEIYSTIENFSKSITKIREINYITDNITSCDYINSAKTVSIDLGVGNARILTEIPPNLFYKVLGEKTGLELSDETDLLDCMLSLSAIKEKYSKISQAYNDVLETGYGIVMPSTEELYLDEPEIIKQGGKYGIRLKASAQSIHIGYIKQKFCIQHWSNRIWTTAPKILQSSILYEFISLKYAHVFYYNTCALF